MHVVPLFQERARAPKQAQQEQKLQETRGKAAPEDLSSYKDHGLGVNGKPTAVVKEKFAGRPRSPKEQARLYPKVLVAHSLDKASPST